MSARWQTAADLLVRDLRLVFGERLHAVVAYGSSVDLRPHGPLSTLGLVSTLTHEDLEACARRVSDWTHANVAIPLLLPTEEFRRSLDAFPLEYADILDAHVVVFGANPFTDVVLAPADLRRACEAQAKGHLVHLREGYIESQGKPLAIARLVADSAPAFAALLRNVARLQGLKASAGRGDTAAAGAEAVGLPAGTVADVLSFDGATTSSADGARLFPAYLAAVEQLAHAVDTWNA